MSGVKNLRAMFEQKGDTSPPDRGRSPGIPWTPSPVSESPRPLSKVRTNFIAIEKDGRIGLQRETSQDSIISTTRKLSGGSDVPTPPAINEDSDVFGGSMATTTPARTNLKDQPIPESPRTDIGLSVTTGLPKHTAEPKSQAPPAATATGRLKKLGLDSAADSKQSTSNGPASHGDSHGDPATTNKHLNGNDHGKGKDKAPNKEVEKVQAKSTSKASPKHLPIPSGKAVAKPEKSPTASKIPRTPTEMTAMKLPTKTPDKVVCQNEKAAEPGVSATSSKATGSSSSSSSIKRPPPLHASTLHSGVGFVKPKPKSPTRPVKLPASLTTHTAASGSKSRQSLSRGSGGLHAAESLGRSPSRGSVSTTATSSARLGAVKSLKRQNSTINRPRPSLGPPPKQTARDHPPTKKEREVDEGFLARMTRPTHAFASKVVGKVAVSPPRKPAAAPAARKPVNTQGPPSKIGSLPFRPRGLHAPSSAAPSSAGPSRLPHISPANKIAIRVEQAETAEEVVEIAKSAEDNAVVVEETAAEETEQNTTAQEIAPVVEHVETAEETVEIAKEVEGDVSLAESSQAQDEDEDPKEDTVEPVHEGEELDLDVAAQESMIEGHQLHQLDGTIADGSGPADGSKPTDKSQPVDDESKPVDAPDVQENEN